MDKTLYVEVLRSEWDSAQAKIEQQAREIERLSNYIEQQDDAYSLLSLDAGRKIDELERKIAALQASAQSVQWQVRWLLAKTTADGWWQDSSEQRAEWCAEANQQRLAQGLPDVWEIRRVIAAPAPGKGGAE